MSPDNIPKKKHINIERIGPKIDPWGSPQFILWISEKEASKLMKKLQSVR